MYDPHSPVHHVTPHNQGQPCSLHAQTVQPDTVESHFGFVSAPIVPCNINCDASLSERYGETEQADVDSDENSTNAYKFQTIRQIAADAGATAQVMSREDIGGQK